MKHSLISVILAVVSLLWACSPGEILALKLEGTWKCAKLELNTPLNHNIRNLIGDGKLTFVKNEGENGGNVTVEVNIKTVGFDNIYNARVVANGAWTAYGTDEILLIFESKDILISTATPSKPLPLEVRDAIKQGFKDFSKINYINIKNGFLKGRISYNEIVMMKK
ncbi:MAG: hypothetical protein K2L77_06080 [Muribaculaceae bacterium]|nr:hypothetical protein [Muribaculaceae bacterium]